MLPLPLIQPHPIHRGVNSVAETLIYERAKVALFAAIPIPHDPFHLKGEWDFPWESSSRDFFTSFMNFS